MAQSNLSFAAPDGYRRGLTVTLNNYNSYGNGNNSTFNTQSYTRFENIKKGSYTVSFRLYQPDNRYTYTSTQAVQVKDGFETNYFVIVIGSVINVYKANEIAIRNNTWNGGNGNNGGWGNNGGYGNGNNGNNGGWGNQGNNNSNGNGQWGYRNIMSDADVADLKAYAKQQNFDDRKIKLFKNALKNSELYTRQVKDLMSTIAFDDKKLEFAKFAYDKVVDKYNYYQLSNAFSFGLTYDDLEEYIAKR